MQFTNLKTQSPNWISNFTKPFDKAVEFYEPLSDRTFGHKKLLLTISIMLIVVVVFSINPSGLTPIKIESIDTEVTSGLLFMVVLYQLAQFVLSFVADLKKHNFEVAIFNSQDAIQANANLLKSMSDIVDCITHIETELERLKNVNHPLSDKDFSVFHSQTAGFRNLIGNDGSSKLSLFSCITTINSSLSRLDNTKNRYVLKKVSTYGFDIGLPLCVSALALYLSYKNAYSVIETVIHYTLNAA